MDVREKMVELIESARYWGRNTSEEIADSLIAHGGTLLPTEGIGEMSDGYHTFNELYHHRAVLFSVICNALPNKAWKSKRHNTGDMYDGMFIVGIETNLGQATYHYDVDPYWDMFNVPELEYAPKWDGHTPQDAIERIAHGVTVQECGEWVHPKGYVVSNGFLCSKCGHKEASYYPINPRPGGAYIADENGNFFYPPKLNYCPNCGAKMDGE